MAIYHRAVMTLQCDDCGGELVEEYDSKPNARGHSYPFDPLNERLIERADEEGWYWPQPDEDTRIFCPKCRKKHGA